MPTYTYRCTKCGADLEVVQSMSDPPLKRCRECRGKLVRTFHPVGIVLKGSGFHKTDYRSSSRSQESKESKESKGSKGSSSKDTSSGSEAKGGKEKSSNGGS